jgi:hypothetical protein
MERLIANVNLNDNDNELGANTVCGPITMKRITMERLTDEQIQAQMDEFDSALNGELSRVAPVTTTYYNSEFREFRENVRRVLRGECLPDGRVITRQELRTIIAALAKLEDLAIYNEELALYKAEERMKSKLADDEFEMWWALQL